MVRHQESPAIMLLEPEKQLHGPHRSPWVCTGIAGSALIFLLYFGNTAGFLTQICERKRKLEASWVRWLETMLHTSRKWSKEYCRNTVYWCQPTCVLGDISCLFFSWWCKKNKNKKKLSQIFNNLREGCSEFQECFYKVKHRQPEDKIYLTIRYDMKATMI